MSVESIEASEQDSSPRELYDITHGVTIYRLTSADHDIVQNGQLYTATPMMRGEIGAPIVDDNESDLEVTLPIDHAFVRRYLQQFVPPQKITVLLRRMYFPSGDVETVFVGEITSMSCDDDNTEATFRVPVRSSEAAVRQLPVLSVSRACPYILYGPGCLVDRNASVGGLAHKVSATVLYVNGRDVRVDLADTDRNGIWAEGGELVVTSGTALGERMSIRSQSDLNPGFSSVADLSMQLPIPGLQVGHSVDVFAGCDHTIDGEEGCRIKFDNKDNFGGFPSLPTANPFRWER